MKISTKGRYALRLMIDLAKYGNDGNVSLKDVAIRQEISLKYLEQIVYPLTKAGLIKSIRGAKGGYSLAYPVENYTVYDILKVLEGPIACVACLENSPNQCPRYGKCSTIHFYEELNDVIINYLKNKTLLDLIQNK